MWGLPPDLAVLAFAVLLDLVGREPPSRLHPTVWMGGTVSIGERLLPKSRAAGLVSGGLMALAIVVFWGAAAYFAAERCCSPSCWAASAARQCSSACRPWPG